MASIRLLARADGSQAFKVNWRDPETKKQTSFTTDSETEADLVKRLLDANGQSFTLANKAVAEMKSTSPTLNSVMEKYLDQLTGIESGTKAIYKNMWANHIRGTLGKTKLEFLDRVTIIKWFEDIDRAPKTKKNVHALLSSCLAWAVGQGLLTKNTAAGISSPKGSLRPREAVFLNRAEVDMIACEVGQYESFVQFLAGTGLRYGEATALSRRNFAQVDDQHLAVTVNRAWKSTSRGMQLGSPKTTTSVRTVTLSRSLTEQVQSLLRTKKYDDLVFSKADGSYLRPGHFYSYHWSPALERLLDAEPAPLLLQRPRVHDLRHTHASWLIDAGVPLPVIQKRLGHASISTTIDVYGHLANDADLRAADVL